MKKIVAALLLLLASTSLAHAAGTANRIPKFSAGTWLSNSTVSDDGSVVSSTLTWAMSGGVEVRGSTTSNGQGNTGVGDNACDSVIPNDPISGIGNSCFGFKAGTSITTGRLNTFIGNAAGIFTDTGISNTAVGHQALYENFTGNSNTAVGYDALVFLDTGDGNTAVGDHALQGTADTAAANYNTALGYFAGSANNTGQRLTLIGASTVGTNLFNATALGYGATVTASSTTVLGNSSVVQTIVNGAVLFSTMTPRTTSGIALLRSGETSPDFLSGVDSASYGVATWALQLGGPEFGSSAGELNAYDVLDEVTVTITGSDGKVQAQQFFATGSTPTVSACGTTPSIVGSDGSGKVTIGTGAADTCTLTFTGTFNGVAPACNVIGSDPDINIAATTTATALVITAPAATDFSSDVLMYVCVGQDGD